MFTAICEVVGIDNIRGKVDTPQMPPKVLPSITNHESTQIGDYKIIHLTLGYYGIGFTSLLTHLLFNTPNLGIIDVLLIYSINHILPVFIGHFAYLFADISQDP